jgi:hypothetical protein
MPQHLPSSVNRSTSKPHLPPPRKRPKAQAQSFRKYAQRVGAAVLSWNDLHANLYLVFWYLIGSTKNLIPKEQVAYQLWHVIQSDRTQHQMLQGVAEAKLVNDTVALERITWILKSAQTLSAYRNLAAHTAIMFNGPVPYAEPWSTRSSHRDRHQIIDHDKFWRLLSGDLIALSQYTANLADDLWRPGHSRPSLSKPNLRSLPLIEAINNQLRHEDQAPKRQHASSPQKPQKGKKSKKLNGAF